MNKTDFNPYSIIYSKNGVGMEALSNKSAPNLILCVYCVIVDLKTHTGYLVVIVCIDYGRK